MADSDDEKKETDGVTVEIHTLTPVDEHTFVKIFAAKMAKHHAHGQWLICEFQSHDESNNKKWKGFQKVYRMKYKPSKFKSQQEVTMNSSNDTDSYIENWGHVMEVLNLVCYNDVYVHHKQIGRKKKKGARTGR